VVYKYTTTQISSLYHSAISNTQIIEKMRKTSAKDDVSWGKLSSELKTNAVKTVVRLFVMRAARNEVVTRAQISASLGAVNPALKKATNSAVAEAAVKLRECFGYLLLPGDHFLVRGDTERTRKDDYYLINELE
jgi:acetone carboxylase gamma subunit